MTKLTDHETEVLGHLAQGYNQKETAEKLKLSPQTINAAVNQIRSKHRSLQRAIEWYMEQNQEQFAADELPDSDEPQGPVQRCERCSLVLDAGHRCLDPQDHLYRQHHGTALRQMGGHGRWTNGYGQGEEWAINVSVTSPVGKGKRG
jgi:DNA-directed RNA polymerase specialized sigma24 family protein